MKTFIALSFPWGLIDVLSHPALADKSAKPSEIFICLGFRLQFKCCMPEQLFEGLLFTLARRRFKQKH